MQSNQSAICPFAWSTTVHDWSFCVNNHSLKSLPCETSFEIMKVSMKLEGVIDSHATLLLRSPSMRSMHHDSLQLPLHVDSSNIRSERLNFPIFSFSQIMVSKRWHACDTFLAKSFHETLPSTIKSSCILPGWASSVLLRYSLTPRNQWR